jgi:hypothetical protein
MKVVLTKNHFATAHEALTEANKVLAANGLPLFTYGTCGGGGVAAISYGGGGGTGVYGSNKPAGAGGVFTPNKESIASRPHLET